MYKWPPSQKTATLSDVLTEFAKLRESVDRHNRVMAENHAKLAENFRTLSTFVSELGEQSFQVETSPFKVRNY